jgi:hypothetical protein
MTEATYPFLLKKQLAELEQEFQSWNESVPVNGLGKFARQVKLDSLRNRIASVQEALRKALAPDQGADRND